MEVDKEKLYTDYKYRLFVAKNLLMFADEALKGGFYYNNRKELSKLVSDKKFNDALLVEFIFQFLFENVRIATFLENFLKAFLLLNNKVVHNIDDKLDSILYKKQNKEPIDISEIISFDILKSSTISPSVLKQTKYSNLTGIDKNFIKKLIPILNDRNKIHFYIGSEINFIDFFEIYERVITLSELNIDPTIKNIFYGN